MSSSRDKRYEVFSGSGASIASIPNSQRRRHNMMTIASSQFLKSGTRPERHLLPVVKVILGLRWGVIRPLKSEPPRGCDNGRTVYTIARLANHAVYAVVLHSSARRT
jgi:hypothetical protein